MQTRGRESKRGTNLKFALHSAALQRSNLASGLYAAKQAGFDGVELSMAKIETFLASGHALSEVRSMIDGLSVTMLDLIMGVERADVQGRARLRSRCRKLARTAAALDCRVVQVVALDKFAAGSRQAQLDALVASLDELADCAAPFGVRLGIEPVSFSPFHVLSEAVEVVERLGASRAGLVLDTWHLWTSGASWDEVAQVDPRHVVCAHISDATPKHAETWTDRDRDILPGAGVLPLAEAIKAICATGYAGVWCAELHGGRHWEWEPTELASELLRRMQALVAPFADRPKHQTQHDQTGHRS